MALDDLTLTPATFASSVVAYVNQVYDTVAGRFVRWSTIGQPNQSGLAYPGPDTFGVHTSDFVVESSAEI